MTRRRLITVAVIAALVITAVRLAVTAVFVAGYRVIDDYNIALEVTGAQPTWRAITAQTETTAEIAIGLSEISLQFGPGFGDERIAYVVVNLRDPIGTRRVVDASTGAEIPRL